MRLTKREHQIISLLQECARAGSELASLLGVSRRTIVREIATVNDKLRAAGAGAISSDPIYHLVVESDERLRILQRSGISDELFVLLIVFTEPEISLSGVARATYLSRRVVQHAILEINRSYEGILQLEPKVGHGIHATLMTTTAPDFLAALASDNPEFVSYLKEACDWDRIAILLGDALERYLEDIRPYLSVRQVQEQAIAAMASAPYLMKTSNNWTASRLRAVCEFCQGKRDLLFSLIAKRTQIIDEVEGMLLAHGISSTRSDLCSLIFDHIVRCSLFPTLMQGEMRDQMHDMRMRHPFEFDFGDDLSMRLRKWNRHLLIEPDFLSLYVLASVEQRRTESISLLLVCSRRSMATINRRFIEQQIENIDIRLVSDISSAGEALRESRYDVLVCDEEARDCADIAWDMVFHGILSTADLGRLRHLARDLLYQRNISSLIKRKDFVSLRIRPTEMGRRNSYQGALLRGLELLVNTGSVTKAEVKLVADRERQGERLNLGHIAFPHAITPVESRGSRVFVVMPDQPIFDEGERIELIVVVLASKHQADKSSIFTYFFSVVSRAIAAGGPLPRTFEQTVRFFEGRAE